jgi:L,D-transpeptidase catalytic domain
VVEPAWPLWAESAESAEPAHRRRRPPRAGRFGWRIGAIAVLTVLSVIVVLRPDRSAHAVASSTVQRQQQQGGAAAGPVTTPAPSGTPTPTAPAPPVQMINLKSDSSPCQTNTASQFVLVSISAQQAWMCQGTEQVNSTPVTTGNVSAHDSTPLGSWRVQARETNQYLTGPGYSDFVRYWVPFNGSFGFHDASWQTFPFGSPLYQTDGSHGCVHFPTPMMSWFFSWISVGAHVTIEA